ncbi:hypothetical protein BDFB_015115 [Asbolus verrucosus]|uniref:Uncharacterized protein n=1 Tax=Asbolus verrucosus TaxID=1661398 RepID=A0A482VTY6_ASBVE|nr:hypothetical protein BDFB_015115 [Asbolus verrucosus]
MYNQVLQRYLHIINSTRKSLAFPIIEQEEGERFKKDGSTTWDDRGVVYPNGNIIFGSNITDLINDITRDGKNAPDPTGWKTFALGLNSINIPLELIGNRKRCYYLL